MNPLLVSSEAARVASREKNKVEVSQIDHSVCRLHHISHTKQTEWERASITKVIQHWVLGSVAERVLDTTRLPLLIVRPPETEFHRAGNGSAAFAAVEMVG